MPTYTPKTFTLVMPDQSITYPGPPGTGNPPDGYVLTWDQADGYYIARPSTKIQILSSPSSSPYTATIEDIVLVPTHAGNFTVNLPPSPLIGTTLTIKDFAGVAAANNIIVQPGVLGQLIDGGATFTINSNFGSIRIVFTGGSSGTVWSIIAKV